MWYRKAAVFWLVGEGLLYNVQQSTQRDSVLVFVACGYVPPRSYWLRYNVVKSMHTLQYTTGMEHIGLHKLLLAWNIVLARNRAIKQCHSLTLTCKR